MTTYQRGSYDNPCTGKEFKEALLQWLDAVANKQEGLEYADGKHCVFVKFANGRMAKAELRAEDEEFDDSVMPLFVHDMNYKQLRRNWAAVSAGIVFGIAFAFEYKNKRDEQVRVVIYKCDDYPGDDFVSGIVADMQVALEFDAFEELSERIDAGFKRVEKLIKAK